MRILVVEDELALRDGLVDLLAGDGHEVEAVGDGAQAVTRGTETAWDLVLLDLMLPRLPGLEVCRRLRRTRPGLPILMLTARGADEDKVRGLSEGADDYVTKPFSARELLARVRVLGRRAQATPAAPEVLDADGCRFDFGRLTAARGATVTALTPREAGILRWLHRHRGRVVPRSELLEQVWGARGTMQTRAVDMAIAVLRKKIERDVARPRIVVSVKGMGYAFGDPA
jgi:two-component system response regulator RegX3